MLNVKLVEQDEDWDCSLSCVNMVTNYKKMNLTLLDIKKLWLNKEKQKNPILWTIDIYFLLKELEIDCIFYTDYLGVRSSYSKEEFYQDCIDQDEKRINQLFSKALLQNEAIEKR